MDDVLAHVVLAGGDEDLGAGDRVAAVGPGHGAGLDDAEVGAAMGLGEAHGASPAAFGEPGQVGLFLLFAAVGVDRRHGAVGQAGVHGPGLVRRGDHLADDQAEGERQPLATVGRVGGQAVPATLDVLGEGFLEAPGRGHHAIAPLALLFVAGAVDRRQHLLAELGAFLEDGGDHVRGGVAGAQGRVAGRVVEDFIGEEADVAQGGLVVGHGRFSLRRAALESSTLLRPRPAHNDAAAAECSVITLATTTKKPAGWRAPSTARNLSNPGRSLLRPGPSGYWRRTAWFPRGYGYAAGCA
ncbi:hypothetical protein D3C84_753180 [compost metagenome]